MRFWARLFIPTCLTPARCGKLSCFRGNHLYQNWLRAPAHWLQTRWSRKWLWCISGDELLFEVCWYHGEAYDRSPFCVFHFYIIFVSISKWLIYIHSVYIDTFISTVYTTLLPVIKFTNAVAMQPFAREEDVTYSAPRWWWIWRHRQFWILVQFNEKSNFNLKFYWYGHEKCKIVWEFQICWGGTSPLKPLRRYLRYFRGTHW